MQNVTDVDDPLFERADRDGIDWRDLGARETQLFRDDMTALRVLPPRDYIGAVESVNEVVEAVGSSWPPGRLHPRRRIPGHLFPHRCHRAVRVRIRL